MDRYPRKYFTSSLLLYRTQGVRFGHSLQRINYGNKKVFVELMLLQGVNRRKCGGPMTMGYLAERSFLTPRNMKVQELLGLAPKGSS